MTMAATTPAEATGETATLRLSRVFPAPRETVFRAFTDPAMLRQWWGPHGMSCPVAEVDLTVGGAYRLEMKPEEGESVHLAGSYLEIAPPARLRFTWIWQQGDMAGLETVVTLDFAEHADGTELTLTHEGLPSEDSRGKHEGGWSSCFDCLAAAVADGSVA